MWEGRFFNFFGIKETIKRLRKFSRSFQSLLQNSQICLKNNEYFVICQLWHELEQLFTDVLVNNS